MEDHYDNPDFCPLCGDPTVATGHRNAFEREVLDIVAPVLDWYQPDDQHLRPLYDILRDIVTDLQTDRAILLKIQAASTATGGTDEDIAKENES
jgi:hypothetical protein